MKETGLKGYVYDFSVDYDAIVDIVNIHKYLMKMNEIVYIKTFRFVKQIFVSTMMFFSCNLSNVNPLECISMNNQESKGRLEIFNVNSKEPVFYPFSILNK